MAISSGGISGAGSNGEFEVFSCNQSSYLQFVQNYAVIDWWTKQWVEYESETSDLTVRELFIVSENYKLIIRKQSRLEIFQLPTQYIFIGKAQQSWEGNMFSGIYMMARASLYNQTHLNEAENLTPRSITLFQDCFQSTVK